MRMTSTTRPLLTLALTLGLMLIGWSGPQVSLAAVQKVDVCHREGNGSYHTISVAPQALSTHYAHGDALPGDAVPGNPAYVFNESCALVVASTCPCDLSIGGLTAAGFTESSMAGATCHVSNGSATFGKGSSFEVVVAPSGYSGGGRCFVVNSRLVQDIVGIPLDQVQACLNDLLTFPAALGHPCQ